MALWLNIVAVLLSPLVAVIVGQRLQTMKARRDEKRFILATCLAHRAAWAMSEDSVRALNLIDIVFSESKAVRDHWKQLKEATLGNVTDPSVAKFIEDKYTALLDEMARDLKLGKLSQLDLNSPYLPQGVVAQRTSQQEAQSLLLAVLKGERPIKVTASSEEQPKG